MTKTCSKCNKVKPVSEFHKNKSFKGGYFIYCKVCKSEADKIYRENHRDKINKKKLEYRNKNKDIINEKDREYYHTHKEERIKHNKQYYNENSEERKEYAKVYYSKNITEKKEYARQYRKTHPETKRKSQRKRRALKQQVQENYTKLDEQYTMTLFNSECANCGSIEDLCIDHHKPLSKGNALTRQNAVVLCNKCNCLKGVKLPENFYTLETLRLIGEKLTHSHESPCILGSVELHQRIGSDNVSLPSCPLPCSGSRTSL